MKTMAGRLWVWVASAGLFFGGAFWARATTIYSTDFESGVGSEWSSTNLEDSVQNPFTTFSGRFGNSSQMLTVSNLTIGAHYSLFFDLYIIDSWDGGSDRFNVDVAGTNLFNESFRYDANLSYQSYPYPPDVGPYNMGWNGYNDSIYRNVEVAFQAVSNVEEVVFFGSGLENLDNESWGLDNLRVQDYEATQITETSLPSGTSASAISWFTITAERALQEASATNAANYDLRSAGVDGLFDTADDTVYTLHPSYGGGKSVTFSIDGAVPLQYGSYRFQTSTNLLDSTGGVVDAFTQNFTLAETSAGRLEDLSNDSTTEADSLMPLTESPTLSGFLTAYGRGTCSSSSDDDYWKFEAEAGDVITAWVEMDRSDVYPYLTLYNASGSQLASANNWTWYSRIQNYTIPAPGTYYLKVDPYYDRSPTPSYTLRLDVGRNRPMESEANDAAAQANTLDWTLDGSSLKAKSAGALVHSDDLFNLGFVNVGNAMSVNIRFPVESTLSSSDLIASIELADGTVLYSTNSPVFAYDFTTNAVHYLRLHSMSGTGDALQQYVLDLTLLDSSSPILESSTLPAEGTTNTTIIDRFSVTFSEYMDLDSVTNPASYRLSSSGADGIWGNADDEIYPLTPSYTKNSQTATFSIEQGPLQPGQDYRFEANTNLKDRVGNVLNPTYLKSFRVEGIENYVNENRSNNTGALATPLGTSTNLAGGSFIPLQTVGVGDSPQDVVTADLNGDLVLDLVTANYNDDSVTVLLGDGEGSFSVETNLVAGDGPRAVAIGNFNADSYPDFAVANELSDSVTIFLGTASGQFITTNSFSCGDAPYAIISADMDGDGNADLVIANKNDDGVVVFYGDGNGAFSPSPAVRYSETRDSGSSFAEVGTAQGWRGDDSWWTLDLPFAFPFYTNSYTRCYVNSNGSITFDYGSSFTTGNSDTLKTRSIISVLLKDLRTNTDTLSDVYVDSQGDHVTIRWKGTYYSGGAPVNFSASLYSNGVVRLSYGAGNESGGFIGIGAGDNTHYQQASVGGGSMSNAADIVFTPFADGMRNALSLPTGAGALAVSSANLDGVAGLDLVVANYDADTISVLLNNGDGTFSNAVNYAVGDGPRTLAIGDMDGDSIPDLVVGNFNADTVSILLGQGDGSFASAVNYPVTDGPVDLILTDMDADGFKDVVLASYNTSRMVIFPNQGDGTLAGSSWSYVINYYPNSLILGDFDGDGVSDIAVVNSYYDQLYIYKESSRIDLPEDPQGSGLRFGAGRGNMHDSSDYDFWSFSADAGDQVVMAIQHPGNPSVSRVQYYLLDPLGNQIGGTYYSDYSDGAGQSPPLTISVAAVYTVVVRYYDSYWGEYRLRVSKVPAEQQLETENNNNTGEANSLNFTLNGSRLESTINGYVGLADLSGDYFCLGNLTSGTVVRVDRRQPLSSALDPLVEILFEDGNPISITSNQVLQFDGNATDYAICNPCTNFPTTALTYEFWMRTSDTSKAGTPVSYARSGQYNEASIFDYRNLAPCINGSYYSTGVSANDGRWHHIAWTWDGITGTSLLYKDGELVHSNGNFQTGYSLGANGAFVLGQDQDSLGGGFVDGDAFLGIMDEVRIWNTVRSQAEIQANMYDSLNGNEAGLVSYWNFEGTSADQASNGNDLALNGGARLYDSDLQGDPATQPTHLEFTTTTNGLYYVRVADFAGAGDLLDQYQLDVSLEDQIPPFVAGTTLPMNGTISEAIIDRFDITFSEEMGTASVSNSANYDLRSAGADGVLDTSDDEIYHLSPSYSSGLTASYQITDGPLQAGAVRLTVSTSVRDRMGRGMDTPYTQVFTNQVHAGFVSENRNNGSLATATALGSIVSTNADGSFVFAESMAVGSSPYALVMTNLNGDAYLDIAVANSSSDDVTILLGNGDGSFTLSTNLVAGDGPIGIEAGTFNADGHIDLAVVNYNSGNVTILLSDGAGGFVNTANYSVGSHPRDLSVADMNGDGVADLVICNEYSDNVGVLLGNGDGSFTSVVSYACGDAPFAVAVGDLNGDGNNDVAVANNNDNTMCILFGNGDGTLQTAVSYTAGTDPRSIVIADVDQDSIQDIVVGNFSSDNLSFFRGLGGGVVTNSAIWVAGNGPWGDIVVQDVNGDGRKDLAIALYYANRVAVLQQDAFGGFGSSIGYATDSHPLDVASGDLDGDGRLDLVTANYSGNNISILLGNRQEFMVESPTGSGLFSAFGYGVISDSSDSDYWSFSGHVGDIVTVVCDIPGHPAGSSLFYELYDPAGTRLTYFYGDYSGFGQSAPITLPADGRYFVRVVQNNAYRGDYNIAVQLARPPLQPESEANNDIAHADAPTFRLNAGRSEARVCGFVNWAANMDDFYSLGNLPSGTVVQVSMELPAHSALVPYLNMVDGSGTYLATTTNQMLVLDGSSDYMRHATTGIDPRSGTVEGWVYPKENGDWGFWQTHDSTSQNWTDWIAMFAYYDDPSTFYFRTGDGSSATAQDINFGTTNYIPPFTWTHLAFTWGGSNLSVYVNGTLVASRSDAVLQDTMDPYACMGLGHGRWLNGWIDEFRIWNRPLSPAEINTYKNQRLTGSESGLVSYWNFDGNTLDATTNANDGELFNQAHLADEEHPEDPASYPTSFSFVTRTNGNFYVRVGAAIGTAGITNQYILNISTYDSTIPWVESETLPVSGSTNETLFGSFSVTFSEGMDVSSVTNPANSALVDISSSTVYPLDIDYTSGTTASFSIVDGLLQPGTYRFVLSTNIVDRSGTSLIAYTNEFVMAGLDGYLLENRNNGDADSYTSLNTVETNLLDGTFSEVDSMAIGDGPWDMVSSDFDGDTVPDLAAVVYREQRVSVLLGTGTNTFNLSTNLAAGSYPRVIASGLINGDNHPDLVVAAEWSSAVFVFLGDGAGSFTNAGSYAVGSTPFGITLADFNGDGNLDLATVGVGSDALSILPGAGDGTFGAKTDYPAGSDPESLAVVDFNQDGTNDIAVTSYGDGTLHLFQGQGDGTFVNSTNLVVGTRAYAVVAADLNLDGMNDLACVDYDNDRAVVLLADGSGGFQAPLTYWTGDGPADLVVRDMDGDAIPDLVVVNRSADSLAILHGDGFGRFSAPVVTTVADDPANLVVDDFDQDGKLDVAVSFYNNDSVGIYTPNMTALLATDAPDGSVHQQHGRGILDSSSDVDNWSFFAVAGARLVLGTDVPDHSIRYCRSRYEIYDPDGVRILDFYSDIYGYGESLPSTLTMGGTYRLRVSHYDNYAGEYRFRVTTVSPPATYETENNNSIANADLPEFFSSTGKRTAWMAGSIEGNDASGDYFKLSSLGADTEIGLQVEFPQSSTLIPALETYDPTGVLVASGNPATNLTYTTTTNGDFTVRIFDASSTRGLDAVYRLKITLSDSTAPSVESISLPAEGTQEESIISDFNIVFSEGMTVDSATNSAHYELLNAGEDGLFETGDDESYLLTASGYTGGTTLSMQIVQSPLQPGKYRFTIHQALTDLMGNPLLADVVRNFEITTPADVIYESRDNGTSATATALVMLNDPDGLRIGGGRGSLKDNTDLDYYAFEASTNETLVLGIDQIYYGSGRSLRYRVVDSNDTVLVELISDYNTQRGQTDPFTVPSNGTYFVRVSSYNDYRGEYRIRMFAATSPITLESEANNDIASANPFSIQTTGITNFASAAGYVASSSDNDYFEVGPVTNDMTILVGVRVPTNSPLVPAVSVYNADGNYMSEEGVTGDGAAEVRIASSNRYFVVIRGAGSTGGFGQDYVLDTEILPTGEVIIPNLRVTQVTPPSTSGILSGDSVSLSYVVENEGSASTVGGAWIDRVVLSSNRIMGDSDDYPLGSFAHAGDLAPGAAYTNLVTVDLPDGIEGPFYIVVYTDFGDQVDERFFDGDNVSSSSGTFPVSLADYPDLRIENLSVSGSNEVGQVLTISWDTANRGVVASGTIQDRVRILRTDTGAELLNRTFTLSGPIAVGATIPHTLSFTSTVSAVYQVQVTADSDDDEFEYSSSHAAAEQNTESVSKTMHYFYNVLLSASPESGGSVSGSGHFPEGSIVTVNAQANTNVLPYTFVNWTTQWGGFQSSATNYTFLLAGDRTLRANFVLPQFALSAVPHPEAGGSVSGVGSYDYASTNVLRAYPSPGYRFGHWSEGGTDLGSSTLVTNVMLSDHALTAWFEELNPFHDVLTGTEPAGVTSVTGAGHYTNGMVAVFSAPQMATNATRRFLFQRMELNGTYLSGSYSYTNRFTTLQPSNMTVVARYTSQPIEPQVSAVSRNYNDPVPATTNFQAAIVFDRSMNPSADPLVIFSNQLDQTTLIVSSNGVWETTARSNDTYRLATMQWSGGMDGDYAVLVSQATDLYGKAMTQTNAATIEVNSTPPDNPYFSIVSSNATSVTLSWSGYTAPSDMDGFRLYLETNAFTSISGLAPVGFAAGSVAGATVPGLELDKDYYVAVAAVDVAGNMDPAVTSQFIRVDSVLPPALDLQAEGQGADNVLLSWTNYNTTGLFGLEGFEVYSQTNDFSSVAGLTPVQLLGSSAETILLQNLDRRYDHYFAVVPYNRLGQKVESVTTAFWSDPYAGLITNDLVIGTAAEQVFDIYRDIVVSSNAVLTLPAGTVLRFHAGTGLRILNGRLVAEGTAFNPIVLTSAESSPDRGDWNGLYLGSGASTSSMRHLWVEYGRGIQLDGCSPTGTALTVRYNAGAGLSLLNGAQLTTTDLLAQYNAVGIEQSDSALLSVSHSIVLNNDTNAMANGASTMSAEQIWWGSTNAMDVASGIVGSVDTDPFLTTEPLLTPAADTADGLHDVGTRTVVMKYACRIAESFRVSEDSSFAGAFFYDFVSTNSILLSEGGGAKTLYVQFRNVNGETNAPIVLHLNYVTAGPTIQSFNLSEGQHIDRPIVVEASATSPLGVSYSAFYVDDVLVASTNSGTLRVLWDIRQQPDGVHRVKYIARDPQDALSAQACNVWISHVPPPEPAWTAPATGTVTAASTIAVAGTAEPMVALRIMRNSALVASTTADLLGNFSVPDVSLEEGANDLVAVAYDDLGTAASSARRVVRDTGSPEAVVLDRCVFTPAGGILLEWSRAETGEAPSSYQVFWSTNSFATTAEAMGTGTVTSVMSANVSGLSDAHYFFGVVGYDGAGNASDLSNLREADYDTTPPSFSVGYDHSSPVGPGTLHVILESSESLSGTPDLLILPQGASGPTMLVLTNTAPRTFEGNFAISALTRTGLAQVRVSASDVYGNVFNGAPAGMDLIVDTTPPTASIETAPASLVQVQSNVTLFVSLTLSEAPRSGTTPQLHLDPPAGATVSVPLSGSGLNWSGSVSLSPLMGSGFCRFSLSVEDTLGNEGSVITSGDRLEIYNTALPTSPPVPNLQNPVAKKGGYVHLVWYPSTGAESYNLYRVPGSNGIPSVVAVSGITTNVFDDLPPADGAYRYAVSAQRRGAESGLSQTYTEWSDRTPPGAPTNVVVQLQSRGLEIDWDAPSVGDYPVRYNVYRNGTQIRSVLTPTPIHDYPPRGTSVYVVASADWLGNEAFSATNEFSMLVPAVSEFQILVNEDQPPVLSWVRGDSSVVGVNLYRNGVKLNSDPLTITSLTDTNYSGNSVVEYMLKSVDAQGHEGPARVAKVYRLGFGLKVNDSASGLPLLNYFDQYQIPITNQTVSGDVVFDSVELRRTYTGGPVRTILQSFTNSISPSTTATATVPMSSMTNAVAQSVRVRLLQQPDASGAEVIYQRLFGFSDVSIDSRMVQVSVTNTPVAGALANFKVRIFNRGLVDMDLVLAKQNGAQPGDIFVSLRNERGEEVSLGQFRGSAPGMILSNDGRGFVTIPPGGYQDVWVDELLVPEALAEGGRVSICVGASAIYYKLGSSEEQVSGPVLGTESMSLNQTPYYGTASTDKDNYSNDDHILISGQALRRSDNLPLPDTPLQIGFAMGAYRWYTNVVTDATGAYSLDYETERGISGQLTIWAAHPDVADRLDQVTIGVYRMFVLPQVGDVRMSKNDTLDISLVLYNPGDTPLTDIGMTVHAYRMDGTNQVDISSVSAIPLWDPDLEVTAKERVNVPLRLQTDIDAPDNAVIELRFASATMGAADTFLGNMTLLEAVPVVDVVEPKSGYVDLTVNRGGVQTRTVTVVNHGVRDLKGVTMTLPATVSWMVPMASAAADGLIHLPDLPVGASNTFDVVFAPPEETTMQRYSDTLYISGTNHPATFSVPLYATVSSEDKGDVQFYVQNTLSLPVPNATIRLRNRLLGTELTPVHTGTNGLAVVENLQEGLWYWQIAAPGNTTKAGSVEVVPDQTVEVSTRLVRNLVTVTFTVVPVPFTDRYEIKIEQTFETHVPAPVLVVTPSFRRFDDIDPGFGARFIVKAKNYGLIALTDFTVTGETYSWGELLPLITYLPHLDPMQEIEIPIQVNFYGDEGTGAQSAQRQRMASRKEFASCVGDMLGAINNFEQNLHNLIDRLAGGYRCASSLDAATAHTAVHVLLSKLDHTSAGKSGLLETAAIAGCMFASSNNGGGHHEPGESGGTAYNTGCPSCFALGTRVLLADGQEIPMEKLVVGDWVRCGVGAEEIAQVNEVIQGMGLHWVSLGFSDGQDLLTVTDEHLVWLDGKGWTAAKNIQKGDYVFTATGQRVQVVSVNQKTERRPLISIRLSGDVALYANGILVHDQCGWWVPPDQNASQGEVTP